MLKRFCFNERKSRRILLKNDKGYLKEYKTSRYTGKLLRSTTYKRRYFKVSTNNIYPLNDIIYNLNYIMILMNQLS